MTTSTPSPQSPRPMSPCKTLASLRSAPAILGPGSSRLLVYNSTHPKLEDTLRGPSALPHPPPLQLRIRRQRGPFRVQSDGALLHERSPMPASVHDGARAFRVVPHVSRPFAHNETSCLSQSHSRVYIAWMAPSLSTAQFSTFLIP
jgi:hypothetical protein